LLINPATGRASQTRQLGGKLDVLVRDQDSRALIIEHKTSSEDLGPGSDYWRRLRMDPQISTYFVGARALGIGGGIGGTGGIGMGGTGGTGGTGGGIGGIGMGGTGGGTGGGIGDPGYLEVRHFRHLPQGEPERVGEQLGHEVGGVELRPEAHAAGPGDFGSAPSSGRAATSFAPGKDSRRVRARMAPTSGPFWTISSMTSDSSQLKMRADRASMPSSVSSTCRLTLPWKAYLPSATRSATISTARLNVSGSSPSWAARNPRMTRRSSQRSKPALTFWVMGRAV
jgi:hypothetical protein